MTIEGFVPNANFRRTLALCSSNLSGTAGFVSRANTWLYIGLVHSGDFPDFPEHLAFY